MRYEAPTTLEGAIALLSDAKAEPSLLAGGTDLLIQMRSGRADPGLLVDIKGIVEMRSIKVEAGVYRVGASVTCMELIEDAAFGKIWPGIIDGVKYIGSVQVKGRATMGGNLCNASPAADSVPALIAAGAVVCVAGPRGRREVPIEAFVTGPGKTTLASGELVVSFLLPRRAPHSGDAYLRFTPRTEMDIAVVGAAVNLTLDGKGVCSSARVCLGAVAARAMLVSEAAAALTGTKVDEAALERLGAAASAACRPIDDKRGTREFRIKVAGVMARRAAVIALERARRQS